MLPTAGVGFKLRVLGTYLSTDDRVRIANPRNPGHFDTIEGRGTSVSDTFCARISVADTSYASINVVLDFFCIDSKQ